MLQGFYWESYRHGHPEKFPGYGTKGWYQIVAEQAPAIRQGRFDLIWLPPPSFAGAHSAGYNPKEYFNLSNSYGDFAKHLWMLASLLGNGVEPVADVVINHRDGTQRWADFKNPEWGTWAITRGDESFTNANSESSTRPRTRGALRRSDRSSTRRTAGPLTNTAHFEISTTRASAFAATSYVICSNSRARATAAGGTTWSMAIMPDGSPCTIGPPLLRFPSENTTGTSPKNSGAGSGIRRRSRVASTQLAMCSTS